LPDLKITFFGHFGVANTGNESTLLAIVSRLRTIYPAAEFCCVCSDPQTVTARYGIAAVPFSTSESQLWDRGLPTIRRLRAALTAAAAEVGQYVRAYRILSGADMLILPGTGLLTDAHGVHGWGPYGMFRWALAAWLRRARVLFVSVGAGPIVSPIGGRLLRATLSLASYRSYRDEPSMDCLRRIGVDTSKDPIYPDLVFGLPDTLLPGDHPASPGAKRIVGLGLMEYSPDYSAPGRPNDTYQSYLKALALFAGWLFERGYEIRLLLGDGDTGVIEDFKAALKSQLGAGYQERLVEPAFESVHDVLHAIAATDVVVATRFHNVLLSLVLNKPVVAISFHHKCSSLMQQMQLAEYCHEIHAIDATRLIEQFQRLEQNHGALKTIIADGVSQARAALDEQYDRLFVTT
jgi:polysaccharide pyruvyl transferase WcaK-like protein